MSTRGALIGGLVLLTSTLAGCNSENYLDPYQKPYAWHPTGAPAANLAAQLDNPRDLVSGRGGPEGDAKASSLALERIWQDRPKQLIDPSGEGPSGGTPGASGGGAGASGSGSGGSN